MTRLTLTLALVTILLGAVLVAAAPEAQVTWGVHTTLVPTYFDPAGYAFSAPYEDVKLRSK